MKIAMQFTVEVDCRVWATEYGLDPTDTRAIRYDVKSYVEQAVADYFADRNLSVSPRE